jgi:hypothetical protein
MVDAGIESQSDGQCVPIGTSVLVFRKTHLVAIAYSRNTPNAVRLIAMTHLGSDEIRLDGIGGPAARLVLTSKTIHLMPIPWACTAAFATPYWYGTIIFELSCSAIVRLEWTEKTQDISRWIGCTSDASRW